MNPRDQFDLFPRLNEAVKELATSTSPMKDKLYNVFISYLLAISPQGNPRNECEEKLKQAIQLATCMPEDNAGEGTLLATLRKTDSEGYKKIAQCIFDAYTALVVPAFRGE